MTTATAPPRTGGVTPLRVLNSEWIKLWTLRSTFWSLLAAIVATIALGMLFSWGFAGRLGDHARPIDHAATMAVTVPSTRARPWCRQSAKKGTATRRRVSKVRWKAGVSVIFSRT